MAKTGIYLVSDFTDYYDENIHDVMATNRFKRLTKSGLSRREMFKFMDEVYLDTSPHGTVEFLYDNYYKNKKLNKKYFLNSHKDKEVVVYLDENLHRGEGKILTTFQHALSNYSDYYASLFICNLKSQDEFFPISYRYLQIGKKSFLLSYSSNDNWRSNCGKVKITLLKINKDKYYIDEIHSNNIKYPLFALDFVKNEKEDEYYIDFNISPGCPETVLYNNKKVKFNKILSGEEAAESIVESIRYFDS